MFITMNICISLMCMSVRLHIDTITQNRSHHAKGLKAKSLMQFGPSSTMLDNTTGVGRNAIFVVRNCE